MNTLIVYGSKYGCTQKCAKYLSDIIKADVIDLKSKAIINLAKYDKVIIGGSVYIGRIRKEVRKFCNKYKSELLNKKLGLFIVGLPLDDNFNHELEINFPKDLYEKAIKKDYFGGEINLEKMNFLEKFILKKVGNVTSNSSKILYDKINEFAITFK